MSTSKLIIATAAASLILVGCATHGKTESGSTSAQPVAVSHHACKGHSSCKGKSACKGHKHKKDKMGVGGDTSGDSTKSL